MGARQDNAPLINADINGWCFICLEQFHYNCFTGGIMGGMVKCPECGKTLHSLTRHDFQQCDCNNGTYVDGGEDYMRVGGKDINKIQVVKHVHLAGNRGVMLLDD